MNQKSQGMQFVLTLLFGPLGLLYSCPGMVIPFIVGAVVVIVVAAMAKLGGVIGVFLLLGLYIAQFIIGMNAVERHNRSVKNEVLAEQDTAERRHQELLNAAAASNEKPPASDTKACPYCAETILAAAVKCKHCGSSLA